MPKGVYPRGRLLWVRYTDAAGRRCYVSTDLEVGQEEKAAKALAIIKCQVEAERELLREVDKGADVPLPKTGLTIAMCWSAWVRIRSKKPKTAKAAKDNLWQGRDHVLPIVGHYLLADFKPDPHALDFIEALQERGLAPSTVRTMWAALRGMFKWAQIRGLVPGNPCVVERNVLPKKRDKDPLWRRQAIYQRGEVETLISDERLSLRDRVLNGILFLAGLRPQEMSALRFRHWDTALEPLAVLDIQVAWDSEYRVEKDLKNEKPRLVPVHPTLSKLLSEWKLAGWEAYFGRKPGPEDLVMPVGDDLRHMQNTCVADIVHRDLKRLGLRRRRAYDARRTFISLCRGDLVPKDIVEMWTHGRDGAVIDIYTDIDWPAHCREMLKLRIERKEGTVLQLRAVSGAKWDSHWDSRTASEERLGNLNSLPGHLVMGPSGFEPHLTPPQTSTKDGRVSEPLVRMVSATSRRQPRSGRPVPLSHPPASPVEITAALDEAAAAWEDSHDPGALRQRLLALLEVLAGGG